MVHFTCDQCGKDLTAGGEQRFVVKIEAYAGFDPTEITDDDLDEDHMEAVARLLQNDEALDPDDVDSPICRSFRFDLCPSCHANYLKDPLGRAPVRQFDFSEN